MTRRLVWLPGHGRSPSAEPANKPERYITQHTFTSFLASFPSFLLFTPPPPPPSLYDALDLEEAPQPPNLEEGLADDDADDEHVPPLDSVVGALGRVSVGALADDNVLLLVLDLGEELGETTD